MSESLKKRIAAYSEPEFQAMVENALRAMKMRGYFFHVGSDLRARDGDRCQLCLEPIDFSLPPRKKMSPSVDHIVPRIMGGPDDMFNLWLAHFGCNVRKKDCYIGRQDGTTDVRSKENIYA